MQENAKKNKNKGPAVICYTVFFSISSLLLFNLKLGTFINYLNAQLRDMKPLLLHFRLMVKKEEKKKSLRPRSLPKWRISIL